MKFKILVTTAPRKVTTLAGTLESILEAGFREDEIFVMAEPESDVKPINRRPNIRLARNSQRRGSWRNFLEGVRQCIDDDGWNVLVYFQDDVRVARNLRTWLLANLWPDCPSRVGCASLYTAAPHAREEAGWWQLGMDDLPRRAYGACAITMPYASARRLLADPPGKNTLTKTDIWLGKFCKDTELGYWLHEPSFVQHVGEHSAVAPDRVGQHFFRMAKRWRTNAVDPLSLIVEPIQPPH